MNITEEFNGLMTKESFENWVPNEQTRYFEVSYTLKGKEFICFVKCDLDKRNWTSIYANPNNPNDFLIRRENTSQELWAYRKSITEDKWKDLFKLIVKSCEK